MQEAKIKLSPDSPAEQLSPDSPAEQLDSRLLAVMLKEPGPGRRAVKWVALLLCVWEVPGSTLGLETGYPDMFRGFPQSIQEDAGIVP
jgi:hypothetical protein